MVIVEAADALRRTNVPEPQHGKYCVPVAGSTRLTKAYLSWKPGSAISAASINDLAGYDR